MRATTAFGVMIRLIVVVGSGLFGAAVVIGHMLPELPTWRGPCPTQLEAVSPSLPNNDGDGSHWYLDPDKGWVGTIEMPRGEVLDLASFSPWQDSQGRRQLVGRWFRMQGRVGQRLVRDTGLMRMSFPDGAVLDCSRIDVIPARPPCWFPGRVSRILFVGPNEQLYTYQFAEGPQGIDAPAETVASPLRWEPGAAPDEYTLFNDPYWPDHPRFRRMFITTTSRIGLVRHSGPPPRELSYVRLNPELTAIEAVEPLIAATPGRTAANPASPTMVTTADGTCLIAYLCEEGQGQRWSLQVARVRFDPRTGAPSIVPAIEFRRDLAQRPTRPIFSSDGRWVSCATVTGSTPPQIQRFKVAELLPPAATQAPPTLVSEASPGLSPEVDGPAG